MLTLMHDSFSSCIIDVDMLSNTLSVPSTSKAPQVVLAGFCNAFRKMTYIYRIASHSLLLGMLQRAGKISDVALADCPF